MLILVVVLVLKESLRTYFKSLSLSWSLGVRSLSLSLSLGGQVHEVLLLVLVLGGQVLVLVLVLGGQVLLTSLLVRVIYQITNFTVYIDYRPTSGFPQTRSLFWPLSRRLFRNMDFDIILSGFFHFFRVYLPSAEKSGQKPSSIDTILLTFPCYRA